jgi:hypothetical protein
MSEEFFLLIQKTTFDVLGVFSRRDAVGTPAAADVAGEYLQIRNATTGDDLVRIPTADLDVKPAAFDPNVIVNPLSYQWLSSGVIQKPAGVGVTISGGVGGHAQVTFTPIAAGQKAQLWLRIEGGGLDQPFTQIAEVTAISILNANPGPFQHNTDYNVACFVQGQQPFVGVVHVP